MLRGVCVWNTGCTEGEAWKMGINGKKKVRSDGGARI
jgi:hypothetical protein